MRTIKQVISTKGHEVASIDPNANAIDAIKQMTAKNIGSMLVIEQGKVLGIISEKDFSKNVIMQDRLNEVVHVREVMSTPVVAVKPEQSIEEGMSIMTEKRVRHLPVMQGDELVGLVSIGDLVKAIIAEQQYTIKQLENYIYC